MERREQLFNSNRKGADDSSLVPIQVNFHDASRRKQGQLRTLPPEEKALCAVRKALAQMCTREQRYFLAGTHCRLFNVQVSPGAKGGDPGTYRFSGRCILGVAHHTGQYAEQKVEFVLSFRDAEDSLGLPTVEFFDTVIDQVDPRTPL